MLSSKNVNIESGNIEFNFKNGNIDSKNGVKRGPRGVGVGGAPADDDRGCYDPVWPHGGPRLTPFYRIIYPHGINLNVIKYFFCISKLLQTSIVRYFFAKTHFRH